MTFAFLSDDWVAAHVEASADLPARPGATATFVHQVTGTPEGTRNYTLCWVDGRITSATAGALDDPDITVITPFAVASALARGTLDPSLAFMRGETKVVGNMGRYVSLLPLTQHDDYVRMIATIDAATTYAD